MFIQTLVLLALISFATSATPEDGGPILSGRVWNDTKGQEIHAHGGGFFFDSRSGLYYWIGTTQKLPPAFLSVGINVYSSPDLTTWTYQGMVFRNTSIKGQPLPGPYRIERPKVLYNQKTNKYVMWFHLDTADFSLRRVGVAVSDKIDGQYEWVSGFKPDGLDSYDMTLFEDDDGSAYLVRTVENQYAGFSKLTADYLDTTGIISKGPRVEGQAVFKINRRYYLLGSHLTGWSPNQAVLSISDGTTLNGATWNPLPVITTSATTYNSQSTYVLPYKHPNGQMLYIYMGDRWNYPNVASATYVWLPFKVHTDTYLELPYYDSWRVKDY